MLIPTDPKTITKLYVGHLVFGKFANIAGIYAGIVLVIAVLIINGVRASSMVVLRNNGANIVGGCAVPTLFAENSGTEAAMRIAAIPRFPASLTARASVWFGRAFVSIFFSHKLAR